MLITGGCGGLGLSAAKVLAADYKALGIPEANLRVFNLDLAAGSTRGSEPNPFHASTVLNPGYADDWRFLFGKAP